MINNIESRAENYYSVEPQIFHPGVVNMAATYIMIVKDNRGELQSKDSVELLANNSNVIIKDFEVIVPYELRKKDSNIIITAVSKTNDSLRGEYKFNFISFSKEPTLFDDFDTDSGLWKTGWYKGYGGGKIENGNMVLTLEDGERGKVLSTDGIFEQAYGCFSSKIKMPGRDANVNCAFWLCTYDSYKKNVECPAHSGGEIDIVELLPPANVYMATVHWYGWAEYHKSDDYREALCFDQTEYNIYSTVWTPKALYWYVNGELRHVYEGEGVVADSHPMVVLLQINSYSYHECGWITTPKPVKTASVYYDWVNIHSLID